MSSQHCQVLNKGEQVQLLALQSLEGNLDFFDAKKINILVNDATRWVVLNLMAFDSEDEKWLRKSFIICFFSSLRQFFSDQAKLNHRLIQLFWVTGVKDIIEVSHTTYEFLVKIVTKRVRLKTPIATLEKFFCENQAHSRCQKNIEKV